MLYKKIPLSAQDASVYLEAIVPDRVGDAPRKALLAIPGGGYGQVCSDREGEPIAHAFLPHDFAAFVLHYTVARKKPFPAQLIEAAQAIVHIKDNAAAYGIDPEQVFTVGFSAGGHLAACTGTLWKHPAIREALDIPYGYNKPRGMMLIYPVIDGHYGSFYNLLCKDDPTPEELATVQLSAQVDGDTVPAFLMHTFTDQAVPVTDSLAMAQAMTRAGVPFELHVYPDAPHGVALANAITSMGNPACENAAIAAWVQQAAFWANSLCQ